MKPVWLRNGANTHDDANDANDAMAYDCNVLRQLRAIATSDHILYGNLV